MKDSSTVSYYAFTRSTTEVEYDGVVAYHDSTGPGQDGHGRKTIVPLRTMLSQDRQQVLNAIVPSCTSNQLTRPGKDVQGRKTIDYAFTRSATDVEYDGVVEYHDSFNRDKIGHKC